MARESGARGRIPRCARASMHATAEALTALSALAREHLPVRMLTRIRAAESNRGACRPLPANGVQGRGA